jgi:hypothetical protein
MIAGLQKADVTLLASLVTIEMDRAGQVEMPSYRQRLVGIRAKLLQMLGGETDAHPGPDTEGLPEFREYARKRYPAELDDGLITMIEYLIVMRRQGVR